MYQLTSRVVVAAGGVKFLTNVFLSVRALRRAGCTLPVEIWCVVDRVLTKSKYLYFLSMGIDFENYHHAPRLANQPTISS